MTTSSTQTISPLRQRMLDDMRMRKLAAKTQSHYLRAVRQFAGFLGRPASITNSGLLHTATVRSVGLDATYIHPVALRIPIGG